MTEFLSLRISKLCGGVATVKVGAATELEMKEKKDRVDDAVAATKAAIEEGVVAGGGITLLRSIPGAYLKDEALNMGTDVVFSSLDAVFNAIVENAGLNPYDFQEKIDPDNNIGFDANSEKIVDMFEAGILNPAKAERLAFETAISVLNLFLSTECIVVDELEPTFVM